MFRTIALLPWIATALATIGCGKTAPPPPAPIEVLVAEVRQQDVPVTGDWVGTTDGYINAQIRAKVQGYLLTQGYRDGSTVKTGQLLYQIDPRQYQADLDKAEGDLAQAKANLRRSQQNEAKYLPLVKVGAVSQQELDNAVQEERGNQAAVDAARETSPPRSSTSTGPRSPRRSTGSPGSPRRRSATWSRRRRC